MNYNTLKALIDSNQDSPSLSDAEITLWLNTPSVTIHVETLVSIRTLMGQLNPVMADDIMTRLEAAAQADSVIARVVKMMQPSEGGIDVGNIYTQASINSLVTSLVLTQEQADAIIGLSEKIVSPAENAGLGIIRQGEVEFARGL